MMSLKVGDLISRKLCDNAPYMSKCSLFQNASYITLALLSEESLRWKG